MIHQSEPLAAHLTNPSEIGTEISITGKWTPSKKSGIFRKSATSKGMLKEWEDIHLGARNHEGMLSTEINHAVGEDAVLVHHVFSNPEALIGYFEDTATEHMGALLEVAKPGLHLIRGMEIPSEVREAIVAKKVPTMFGEYLFGYVKDDYKRPDPASAIQVTAKWTCKSDDPNLLEELKY
jgi:hypothetical protein